MYVMINGVLWDKQWKAARPVVLFGEVTPVDSGGSTEPPGIWGPNDPRPNPPIQLPPWVGGWQPGIWGPTDPRPGYWVPGAPGAPGYKPPLEPPTDPPEDPSIVKPPPPDGGWGWSPEYGWGYFPGSGGAGPKGK